MIISALNEYYERLAKDPKVEIPEYGFSQQKIAFEIVISKDGKRCEIADARIQSGKNMRPRLVVVPGGAKPPGAGINPCFLWDNSAYMLGYKPEDSNEKRTAESFEAFKDKHLQLEDEIKDTHFSLVCKFLTKYKFSKKIQSAIDDVGSGFGLFRIEGARQHVHQRPKVRTWWQNQIGQSPDKVEMGQCLATGKNKTPLARIHEPKIKGVAGAQSAGAAIVSFNFDSAESYGKEQGSNAPVSQLAAFQYSSALNHLLNSGQRLRIGDATTVFWADKPSPFEDWLGNIIDTNNAEDESTKKKLNSILQTIAKGGFPTELGQSTTGFNVLGLSPNAARISIRFWMRSTLGQLVENLGRHFRDLEIVHTEHDNPFPALWQLLSETARESKDISPQLSGDLMRSVLRGDQYPQTFLSAVLRRIKADREIYHRRAAIVKAFLNRNFRIHQPNRKEISVALDTERPEAAYHLGRLFAQLEKAQEDAFTNEQGKVTINKTIKDNFFGAASASPLSVFPRIVRMSQHHLGKLEKKSRVYHEKRIGALYSMFDKYPAHLNLHDQGLFAIGYYHQRQDIFTTKKNKVEES